MILGGNDVTITGNRIELTRMKRGVSQKELAKQAGIPYNQGGDRYHRHTDR